jgi:hypothetical protein
MPATPTPNFNHSERGLMNCGISGKAERNHSCTDKNGVEILCARLLMRDIRIPDFRRRYRSLMPACAILLPGAFVLYGYLGTGWWMWGYFPVLLVTFFTFAWRGSSVRCPCCHRLVYEQEHYDIGKPMVFLCRQCDVRLITDVPSPIPG